MRNIIPVLFFLIAVSSIGCATPGKSSFKHVPAGTYTFENEKIVQKPFDEVWDGLVRELVKSFFVINNIEKASRIINVSFFTDNPEDYIDCGKTERTFHRSNEHRHYHYDTAASTSFKRAGSRSGGPLAYYVSTLLVNRQAVLEGRINIYVAPCNGGTQVSVNCRYIWNINITGTVFVEDQYGTPVTQKPMQPSSAKCSFNTRTKGKFNARDPKNPELHITCISKRKIEKDLLDLVK